MNNVLVRTAAAADAELLCNMLHALAEFEGMSEKCQTTAADIAQMLTEPNGLFGLVAEVDGKAVGMALLSFYRLATFSGKRVCYVEDVFVAEGFRGCGVGTALFEKIKEISAERRCIKTEWKCLSWNENARRFYERIGGVCSQEWLTYTIEHGNY